MNRLNDVTRATYLLGYYPTNAHWDGAYRKVTVKVSRPGITVHYRHGYYGRKDLVAFNRREFITTTASRRPGWFRREITDIRVKVDARMLKAKDGPATS